MLDSARIYPSDYAGEQKQSFQGIDPEKIDWEQLSKMGVSRESLEKGKELEAMLKYRKSPHLGPISVKIGDIALHTDARLSLRETEDGRFIPVVHAIRKEPQLEREFFVHTFTDEDGKALLDVVSENDAVRRDCRMWVFVSIFHKSCVFYVEYTQR